jgi:diacylglycerol kinase (ATP)
MHLILLHNPTAGDEVHDRGRLESILTHAGHEVVYRSLKDDDWTDVLEEPSDLIVVAGGDGSVRKLFTATGSSSITATLFPVGSANNIARTLGFDTDDPLELLSGWGTAVRESFDLWHVTSPLGESTCVESVGGGLFADVLARAEDVDENPGGEGKVDLGLRLLAETLDHVSPSAWEIELDGTRTRDELLGVEAMNVRELGPNLPLAPAADPTDGLLDVVLLRPQDRAPLADYVAARLRGGDPVLPPFDVRRCRKLVIEPSASPSIHVDDVLPAWDEGQRRWAAVLPAGGRLDVLVPSATRQSRRGGR